MDMYFDIRYNTFHYQYAVVSPLNVILIVGVCPSAKVAFDYHRELQTHQGKCSAPHNCLGGSLRIGHVFQIFIANFGHRTYRKQQRPLPSPPGVYVRGVWGDIKLNAFPQVARCSSRFQARTIFARTTKRTSRRHVSDKQTSRLFLQTHKPSVFQNHVFKTKT